MKKEFAKYLVLVLLAIGSAPASAALWQWATTPSSNGTADPTINYAVGMAPSAVDSSARAMMARVAEYRDDISGALATTGTSTAYAVTTNQSAGGNGICTGTAPANGTQIAVTPNVTNGIAPTIAVDSCTAAPIQQTAGAAVASATMIAGTPYRLTYSTANTAWMLQDFHGNPYNIPLGGMMPYTLATAPNSNFILPAGQCLSTTTYNAYYLALGSPSQGACASGQWPLAIDMRGKVPAGLDNLNGSAANILTSAALGCGTAMTSIGAVCANGVESFVMSITQLPVHYHSAAIYDPGHTHVENIPNNGGGASWNNANGAGNSATYYSPLSTQSSATGVRVNSSNGLDTTYSQGGSGNIPRVQPTIAVTYILRVI